MSPELGLPGSAGVIDGSIWKDKDGNELITEITDVNTRTSCTYHVKNDCFLCIKTYSGDIGNNVGYVCIDVFVNGTNMGSMLVDVNQYDTGVDNQSIGLPVAEGSVVELKCNNGTSNLMSSSAGRISFTEFKLRATKYPDKMIVPNWSGEGTAIASGGSAPADGWIVVDTTDRLGDGYLVVIVNGVTVWRAKDGSSNTKGYAANIPVAKNDIVAVSGDYTTTIKFYPAK